MRTESGDEGKPEHRPGRDTESDKRQRADTESGQRWPLCGTGFVGSRGHCPRWGCFQELQSISSVASPTCASVFSPCGCQAPGQHRPGCQRRAGAQEKESGPNTSFIRKITQGTTVKCVFCVPGTALGASEHVPQRGPIRSHPCDGEAGAHRHAQIRIAWQGSGCPCRDRKFPPRR